MTEEQQMHVLIVEDDRSFQRILERRLQAWSERLAISAVSSLAEAEQLLQESAVEFSLVILDQHLPDGAGVKLLEDPRLESAAVLAVSSDESPEVPARAVRSGALYFMSKRQVTQPLFTPLLEAVLERKQLEKELLAARMRESRMATIKRLLATLQHEINNPLGAVLGGTYLIRAKGDLGEEQVKALELVEQSGQRIKHVIKELCQAAELEEVTKGREKVFQVPGDKKWEE